MHMCEEQRKILILGLGNSGWAAAELALQQGNRVIVLDEQGGNELADRAERLERRGAEVHLEWNHPAWENTAELAIISPGIAPDSTLGRLAAALACPVVSELEYGFQHAPCPVLAVTGTNGKSTTVELLDHCLRQAGYRSVAAGNIGTALCDAVRKHPALDYLVVEVSSYQLEKVRTFRPFAGALLNLSPDHLDRYATVNEYYRAKLPLLESISDRERIVLRDDLSHWPLLLEAMPASERGPITFSATASSESDFFLDKDGALRMNSDSGPAILCHRRDLRLKGRHNIENVLAALALGHAAGLDANLLVKGAQTFPPSPHRLELVGVHDGIQFINDSKSTNPDSLMRAIDAVAEEIDGKILLLAGGLDKGLNFTDVKPFLHKHVAQVFLFGNCREKLANLWRDAVPCKIHSSMQNAFETALESAGIGDTVLLSPGCASQDMFRDYAERGRYFSELIIRSYGQ